MLGDQDPAATPPEAPRAPDTNSQGLEAGQADLTTYEDHGEYVSFQTSFAAEGIFKSSDGEPGWRSPEQVKKMVPFCNGMRVVVGHPNMDPKSQTCVNLNDAKFPVIGWTSDAKAVKSTGVWKVIGNTNIWKNRNGIDARPVIAALKTKEMGDVSIGYYFSRVPKNGVTQAGQNYGHLEEDVNPYHLAILDGQPPACPQPICGIGCASQSETDNGSDNMKPGESGTPPQETPTPAPPTECANCKAHAETQVKATAAENQSLKTKVQELEQAVNAMTVKVKEGDEAKAKLEAIKVAERKAKVDKMKELMDPEQFKELFPEDAKDASDAEIARFLKVLETKEADQEAEAPATPPEVVPETAAAKPAANSALKPPAGKTTPPTAGANADDGWLPDMYLLSKKRLAKRAAAKLD
jgi:hypothetical protein